jgi:hypothetical protein
MNGLTALKIVEPELPPHITERFVLKLQTQDEVSEHGLGLSMVPDPQNVKLILTRRLSNARKANIEDVALEREAGFFNNLPQGAKVWRLHYYDQGKRFGFLIDATSARFLKQVGDIPFSQE